MKEIIEGFLKFQHREFPKREALFKNLASKQNPRALFISCSDSRLVPELVTQREPGDLFVIRNAGNIVPCYGPEPGGVSATVEYAIAVLKVSDVVICGHSNCGAMSAIATQQDLQHLPAVDSWLHYAEAAQIANAQHEHADLLSCIDALARENVRVQLANIQTHPSVRQALQTHQLTLHGWVYDIASGHIDALNGKTNEFVSLAQYPEIRFRNSVD